MPSIKQPRPTEQQTLFAPAGYLECIDCRHMFHVDSSPHLERCWQCAERWELEK